MGWKQFTMKQYNIRCSYYFKKNGSMSKTVWTEPDNLGLAPNVHIVKGVNYFKLFSDHYTSIVAYIPTTHQIT